MNEIISTVVPKVPGQLHFIDEPLNELHQEVVSQNNGNRADSTAGYIPPLLLLKVVLSYRWKRFILQYPKSQAKRNSD
jgi:hypothetical protein